MQATDVQGAIDELYKTCTEKSSGEQIITKLPEINPNVNPMRYFLENTFILSFILTHFLSFYYNKYTTF